MKRKPTKADVERMSQAADRAEAELDALLANSLVTREVAPLIRQFEADGDALARATELRIRRAVEGVADPVEAERIAERLTAESLEQLEDLRQRVEAERITLPPLTRENWRRRVAGGRPD
jgi:hypothetical protein